MRCEDSRKGWMDVGFESACRFIVAIQASWGGGKLEIEQLMWFDGLIGESTDASDSSVALDVCAEVTIKCHFVSSRVASGIKIAFVSFRGADCADTILRALAERPGLHCVCGFALGNHLTCVELNKHRTVGFDLFDGH
jgi:hypothetical protein